MDTDSLTADLPDPELPLEVEEVEVDAGEQPMYEHFRFVADPGQQPIRVDRFLTDRLVKSSRNRVQQAAQAGCVLVGDRAVKSNYRVKPGDVVRIVMDRPRYDFEIIPQDIPLEIVYEDDTVLVVNKPAGMVVHPGHGNYSGTLVNALAWHFRDNPDYDVTDPRLGLVHRIDKDTSGLLVVAKSPEAKTHLGRQFFNKTTRREYIALVWGVPEPAVGTITGNIDRDPRDRLRMAVFPPESERGRHAVTHYEVTRPMLYVSAVRCVLETGRTHQIRAHMRSIGHPLFNDERYGGHDILRGLRSGTYRAFVRGCFDLCPRQALHARTLGFVHPRTGREMDFSAPLPEDMQRLMDRWAHYAESHSHV